MPLQLVTPPALEPVTLSEARLHLRVDTADDDPLIGALISAARVHAEMLTARQFLPARWRLVLDRFTPMVLLNRSPVVSVVSVRYLDMGGLWQIMPPTDYVVESSSEPARITPAFGKIWPPTLPQIGSVEILFDAGYTDATKVPDGIKRWMLLRVGSLYQHREEMSVLPAGRIDPLPFVDSLLDPYRVVTLL
ncbi:phage head-tail connector protein [Ferriphaselus sp. R-1]|uniref:head-tail connector protein n=1 Tax=Ferriphaselus sp. R-1 TaxID=1485544 RepID=UPI000557425A|nr:phage head-tail connector protein [Ferriphaselus sp. R-1]